MNNGKTIREALRKAKKQVEKPNAYKYDVIYGDLGQYAAPGEVTRIQGDAYGTPITMAGVPYPLYGEDDLGYGQMMYPGMDYTFPGQYVTEIPMAQKGKQVEDTDSWLENIVEIIEPTGMLSWDDVYRAYKNTGLSDETALEVLGAIPLLGKIAKVTKPGIHLAKYTGVDKILKNTLPKNKSLSRVANASSKIGRGTDAIQMFLGAKDDSGFTWDMRHGEVPKFGGRNIFPQIELGEHGDYAYGGDPSLPNITGHYQKGGAQTPEEWEKEIRAVEHKIGDPSTWTLDSYKLLQDKLNEYKAWRENTPEGKAVIDYHNEPNEYIIPLPSHLQTVPKKPFGGQNTKTHTHMKEGGWLDQYQRRGEVMPSETTQSFIPAGLRYKMDQLKRQDPKQKQKLAEEKKYYEDIDKAKTKAKEDARKQEVADRKARIADSIEAQKESVIGNPNWREVLARQTQATGDKFRVSDEPNFFDDYINPGVWIGDMASGLGQAPYAAKESNSNLPYALAIGAPLLTGALEGIGGKSAKDFITNIISPVPFTGEMINKGLNKIGKTAKNTSKYFNKKTSTAPFKINVEPNSNISADFNKKVEDVIQKNIDRVKSDTYKKRRIANTGETEEQVNKSINKYINNIKKAKFEFPNYGPKSTAEGVYYQPGSLFGLDLGRHKINVHTVGKTEDDILEVLDHEVKHMLSPLSKNSEYKLYKNYPTLEINPTIKNKDYYLLPEEQQVRFNRLNEKIRKDLNINKENLSLEDILYWNKNYQDDLLKGPKGYSDIKKLFKAAKNPISATTLKNVLNKSWAVLPAAVATGAYQQQEEGGSIGGDDFRRGGLYTPPKIKRKTKKYGTSKNIQSSINKLFTRNYDVFGPSGRNIYNPKAYKTGGWLDNVD